jgi:hypothetical protein
MASRRRRRTADVGDGASAEIEELLGAGELEQRLEKLVRGSVGAMGGWPWLPTTSRSRWSESRGRAAMGLGSRVGETAKAQDEWFAGVFVLLMRTGVKALGFCTELSTAATMWRPAVAREFVARAGEGSRGGE